MKKLFILAPLLVSSSLATAADYCNTRFDYCVDVPSQLQWLPEAESGDGRHFQLADSQAQILVFGSHTPAVFGSSDEDYLAEKKREYHTNTTVTYEVTRYKSYTVSGYDEYGRIYYHVIKLNNGKEAQLQFNYPLDEKQNMDSIVTTMARSFVLN